jgi:putative transposase
MQGYPRSIRVDNGPEFTGKLFQQWAEQRGIHIEYIEPGKPMDNGFIESFNGKFRDECLDVAPKSTRHSSNWK